MPDRKDTRGYEPAPWEEPARKHTGSVPSPPQPPRPQRPTTPYLGSPRAQDAQPVAGEAPKYHQPPLTPGLQAAPQQSLGVGAPSSPQHLPGQPVPQAPYGYGGAAPAMMQKPNSTLAMVSLILIGPGFLLTFLFGIFALPIYVVGIVLGVLGLRETGRYGTKSGRGLAIAGTITNSLLLAGTITLTVVALLFISSALTEVKETAGVQEDAALIIQRVGMYERAKGDLGPGGPQMVRGLQSTIAVQGSLKVGDLVSLTELKMDIENYRLQVDDDAGTATLYYADDKNNTKQVGRYPSGFRSFDFE